MAVLKKQTKQTSQTKQTKQTRQAKKTHASILFTAFEAAPFSKTGGLGDVAGSLPYYVNSRKFDIRVVLPKLSAIPEEFTSEMEFLCDFNVQLGWRNQYCGLYKLVRDGLTFYFLDNEYYFKRANIYGEFDDGERVAFFSKAVLDAIPHLEGFRPDIIHANDWHTAMVPVFLRECYMKKRLYSRIRTVFTIHNLKFQGNYDPFMIGDVLGLHGTPAEGQLLSNGRLNYLKGACVYSDMVTTVSPTYAREICTDYYGEGLNWLFSKRADSLVGILNGIDYKVYDPAKDKSIAANFSASDLKGKTACKLALQKYLGLPADPDIPLFCLVSRLTEQKGLDLVNYMLPELARRNMQLAILGVGSHEYEEAFRFYANACPTKIAACLTFSEELSHRFFAGGDVLLMPSRFEPCGLSQMMAMRYGCLPLVRETGGLRDSVVPYNRFTSEGTGFSFANFNAHELLGTVDLALDVYANNRQGWITMQEAAMKTDFSWKSSAEKYQKMYLDLL